ncbi:hypothetical protein HDU93_005877 [Gonapodya sp. JEL0774]|nr:hypothetical protein HDU93_005877 [Gonapodya sp. JEL0774]
MTEVRRSFSFDGLKRSFSRAATDRRPGTPGSRSVSNRYPPGVPFLTVYTVPLEPFTVQFRLAARLKASPDGKLPLVRIDHKHIFNDVLSAITYIDGTFADAPGRPPLYPATEDRNEVDAWANFVMSEFVPNFERVLLNGGGIVQARHRPLLKSAFDRIGQQLRVSGGPWFFGSHYSLLDVLIAPFAARRPMMIYLRSWDGVTAGDTPLLNYLDRLVDSDGYREVGHPLEAMKASFKSRMTWLLPLSIYRMEHDSQRALMNRCLEVLTSIRVPTAMSTPTDVQNSISQLLHLRVLYGKLSDFVIYHTHSEEALLYPKLGSVGLPPESIEAALSDHKRERGNMITIYSLIDAAIASLNVTTLRALYEVFPSVCTSLNDHLQMEEAEVLPYIQDLSPESHAEIVGLIYKHFGARLLPLLAHLLGGLNPPQRAQYVLNLQQVLGVRSDEYARVLAQIKKDMHDYEWRDIVERVPGLHEAIGSIQLPIVAGVRVQSTMALIDSAENNELNGHYASRADVIAGAGSPWQAPRIVRIGLVVCDELDTQETEQWGRLDNMFETYFQAIATKLFPTWSLVMRVFPVCPHGVLPTNVELDALDAVVIAGSKYDVFDDVPWIRPLFEFVKQNYLVKRFVGVGFGHQVVNAALGGKVEQMGFTEVRLQSLRIQHTDEFTAGVFLVLQAGHQSVHLTDIGRSYLRTSREKFDLHFLHTSHVREPAPMLTVLGSSSLCGVQITTLQRRILTFQAHPEYPEDYAYLYLQYLGRTSGQNYLEELTGMLESGAEEATTGNLKPVDRWWLGAKIVTFLATGDVLPDNELSGLITHPSSDANGRLNN